MIVICAIVYVVCLLLLSSSTWSFCIVRNNLRGDGDVKMTFNHGNFVKPYAFTDQSEPRRGKIMYISSNTKFSSNAYNCTMKMDCG